MRVEPTLGAARRIETLLRHRTFWSFLFADPSGLASAKIGIVHPANVAGGLPMHFVEAQQNGGYVAGHG